MDSKDLMKQQSKEFEINTLINEQKLDTSFMDVGEMHDNAVIQDIKINADFDNLEAKEEDFDQAAKIRETKEAFRDSVDVYDKKKVKAVKDQNFTDGSKFVSLYRNNELVARDSEKMVAVKNAINRYLEHKGEAVESNLLETIIRACNEYTSGKISFLRLGDAGRRLKEVKSVRKQAELELLKIRAVEAKMTDEQLREKKKERTRIIKADEEYYAPELDAHYRKLAAKTNYRPFLPDTKRVIEILRDYYPAMSFKEAEHLAIRNKETKLVLHDGTINTKKADELISQKNKKSAEKKKRMDALQKLHDRAAEIEQLVPGTYPEYALKIAKKERELGKEYSGEEIVIKFMPEVYGPYKIYMAKKSAIYEAKHSNIVHRFFSWITNYQFDIEAKLQDVLTEVSFKAGKDAVHKVKNDKGEVFYTTEEHGDYEDTFI